MGVLDNIYIKTIYNFWEDIAKDSPFSIEPENIIIPPYEKKLFNYFR